MIITKYEHACFTVEQSGQRIVVDPGNFTTDFDVPENVVAIVVTHEHPDHFDSDHLDVIIQRNPHATIYALSAVTSQLANTFTSQTILPGDTHVVGPFSLQFFGGEHAVIHQSMQPVKNVGVFINDGVYYPGDALHVPNVPVDVLALPVAAPWLKISEVIDFLLEIKPRVAFPTHDAIYSDNGKDLVDRILTGATQNTGIQYRRLTEPTEI